MKFKPLEYGHCREWKIVDGAARLVPVGKMFIREQNSAKPDVAEVHCTSSQKAEDQERLAALFTASPALLDALKDCLERLEAYRTAGLKFPVTEQKAKTAIYLATHTRREIIEAELRDAWQERGKFNEWLREMADNEQGTLQEAAKELLGTMKGASQS